MKLLIALIALSVCCLSAAHADDMQKYLRDSQELVRQGKYPEALTRYIWFHDHALEHQPGMSAVRLSFALSYWKQLGDRYPPALAALVTTRDNKTALIAEGSGNPGLFADVSAINRTLEQNNRTVDLFRLLDQQQTALAKNCWVYAQDTIIMNKDYDLARKYRANPRKIFQQAKSAHDRNVANYGKQYFDEHFKKSNEENFVSSALRTIELSTALGDSAAAREIQEKALAVVNDRRLREVTL